MAGFMKGQSDNLPKINPLTIVYFLKKLRDSTGVELKRDKDEVSRRESYGDNTVGYVQVKQENHLCTVKAVITPEHEISKGYEVTVICNEEDEVISAECDGCAASLGGCQHAIAMLYWLHRRSEDPPVTDTTCYWKKSKSSKVSKSLKFIKAKDIGKGQVSPLSQPSGSFLSAVLDESKKRGINTALTKYFRDFTPAEKLSIHQLIFNFFQSQQGSATTAFDFFQYCSSEMSETACQDATAETQDKNELWLELCYGRITASKAYESARCDTINKSLVDDILCPLAKDPDVMKQRRDLENEVRKLVEEKVGIKIQQTGFYTSPDCPVMGASVDGISDDYIIKIKCPSSEKPMEKYIYNGNITEKYNAEMQLQMYFAKKHKGLFCVAKHDFKTSKEIIILTQCFDVSYCDGLIEKCNQFWKAAVFPVLQQ